MFGLSDRLRQNLGRIAGSITAVCFAWIALPANHAEASDAVLVSFSSSHCPPCRAMQPVLAQLQQNGVPVRHVDVNQEPHLAQRYGIRQTPTFVVVSAGKEVTRMVGRQSYHDLRAALDVDLGGPLIQTDSTVQSSAQPRTRLSPLRSHDLANTLAAAPRSSAPRNEAMPSIAVAGGIERAEAATVRLKVHDGRGFGVGTGTIIDTKGEYALVLTCGHLFRENQGKGRLDIELFVGGQTKTVPGRVLDYDAEDRDIALVEIKPGFEVQPVPLLSKGQPLQSGQSVYSFGCDRGDDPSRRDSRITGVNKYTHNQSNVEIDGAPIDGRSGGGLFDQQGRLIGVCNAADYKGDVGIYTGPGIVQWQLDRLQLSNLYQPRRTFADSGSSVRENLVASRNESSTRENLTPSARIASVAGTSPGVRQASATEPIRQPARNSVDVDGSQELIVIVRDPNNPSGLSRVMTLEPTAELMRVLERHAR